MAEQEESAQVGSSFVNVPVPEEHVFEVMQHIVRLHRRARIQPWDQEAMTKLFSESEELLRALLSLMARAARKGDELTTERATSVLEVKGADLRDIHNSAASRTQEMEREPLYRQMAQEVSAPGGRVATRQVLTMEPEVAELVREAERQVNKAESHPLEADAG